MTTPSGADLVGAMSTVLSYRGEHYGADDCPHRCNPELPPFCEDCSGAVTAAARLLTLGWAAECLGSFAIAQLGYAAHGLIPFSTAVHTPGAIGTQGKNQGRGGIPGVDDGHVVVFVGDGIHTLEARGHASGIGVFRASSLRWDGCYFLPGLAYGQPATMPVPALPAQAAGTLEDDLMTTIALPASNATPPGQHGICRALREFNVVYLEAGGRLLGDVLIKGTDANDKRRHYWAPDPKVMVPGATIFDVQDLRTMGIQAVEAIYTAPDGTQETYMVPIPPPEKP